MADIDEVVQGGNASYAAAGGQSGPQESHVFAKGNQGVMSNALANLSAISQRAAVDSRERHVLEGQLRRLPDFESAQIKHGRKDQSADFGLPRDERLDLTADAARSIP